MFGILAGIFPYRADSREKVEVSVLACYNRVAPPSFTVTVPEVVTGNKCFFCDRTGMLLNATKISHDMYNFARFL